MNPAQACDRPFRILSLDGGGIRGAYIAAFLAELERILKAPVGTYFDLIAGTSTGGLIALALAFRLPAQKITDFYLDSGTRIFKRQKPLFLSRCLNAVVLPILRSLPREKEARSFLDHLTDVDALFQAKYDSNGTENGAGGGVRRPNAGRRVIASGGSECEPRVRSAGRVQDAAPAGRHRKCRLPGRGCCPCNDSGADLFPARFERLRHVRRRRTLGKQPGDRRLCRGCADTARLWSGKHGQNRDALNRHRTSQNFRPADIRVQTRGGVVGAASAGFHGSVPEPGSTQTRQIPDGIAVYSHQLRRAGRVMVDGLSASRADTRTSGTFGGGLRAEAPEGRVLYFMQQAEPFVRILVPSSPQ